MTAQEIKNQPIVSLVNEKPTTTSLNVAEVFGKRHDDVLKAIRSSDVPDNFRLGNFAESSYTNSQGKDQPMYQLTRDGFMILVMGFTGSRAMKFKLAYIEAFNQMEVALTARTLPPPDQPRRLPSPGLTPEQQRAVQVLIGERVYATDNKAMYPQMFRTTYRRIKDKFLVAKYDQVPQGRFEELVAFINSLFAPVSKPTVSVSRDEFESFVKEYRIRNKVMNEYLDDIWATGNGILSVAKRLGELDGDLTGIAVKAIRTRAYESIVADIEATRNETQSILGSLLDTTRLFFVKHSKINHRMPDECARISGRV